MLEKKDTKALREKLTYQPKNGYDRLSADDAAKMEEYCRGYKTFLDAGKTERECVIRTVELAQAAGFRPYERGMKLQPGDRIYRVTRGKAIMLAVIGKKEVPPWHLFLLEALLACQVEGSPSF